MCVGDEQANVTASVLGMGQCHAEGKIGHPALEGCKVALPECGPVSTHSIIARFRGFKMVPAIAV